MGTDWLADVPPRDAVLIRAPQVFGRPVSVPVASGRMARFTFPELCSQAFALRVSSLVPSEESARNTKMRPSAGCRVRGLQIRISFYFFWQIFVFTWNLLYLHFYLVFKGPEHFAPPPLTHLSSSVHSYPPRFPTLFSSVIFISPPMLSCSAHSPANLNLCFPVSLQKQPLTVFTHYPRLLVVPVICPTSLFH